MRARDLSLLLVATTLLAGCGSLLESDREATSTYTLTPPRGGGETPAESAAVLEIAPLSSAPGLSTDRILLWRQPRHLEHYAAVRWAETAPELVRDFLRTSFANRQNTLDVADVETIGTGDFRLHAELRDFHADYTQGSLPVVRVSLRARLIDADRRERIGVFAVSATADATDNSISGVVAAFDAATAEVTVSLLEQVLAALGDRHGAAVSADGSRSSP